MYNMIIFKICLHFSNAMVRYYQRRVLPTSGHSKSDDVAAVTSQESRAMAT
mgnify:CR=1